MFGTETILSKIEKVKMYLTQFEVQNFRSLERNIKVDFGRVTNIVGANNEGKSNLVRAMHTATQLLRLYADEAKVSIPAARSGNFQIRAREHFLVERDYPKKYQEKRRAETRFRLKFNLSPREMEEFKSQFGSQINNEFAIEIKITPSKGENSRGKNRFGITIEPIKSGVAKKTLTDQMDKIALYLSNKFSLVTSQAVRPGTAGVRELQGLLENRLRNLNQLDEDYKTTILELQHHRKRIIDEVSSDFKATLGKFIPDLSEFQIKVEDVFRSQTAGLQVTINDGVATDLGEKGDGVQSLFTLALLQHKAALMRQEEQNMLTVVEEPEAHLNSGAMHELNNVLKAISEQQQVVIVTHSAIFIDRDDVKQNIIVRGNRAYNANSIGEIRTALGIQPSEALSAPEVAILVEGKTDKTFLEGYLKAKYTSTLFKALGQNRICIQETGGTSHLQFYLNQLQLSLTKAFAITDNDPSGQEAFLKVRKKGLLDQSQHVSLTHPRISNGKQPAAVTIEDAYLPEVLTTAFNTVFGTQLESSAWEECRPTGAMARMKQLCIENGKLLQDDDVNRFKIEVGRIGLETSGYAEVALKGVNQLLQSVEKQLVLA
ncbi:ATP-dependent nuclease [Corynebacterium flavescens]|uniref:ATP-dependent nuclease n=1 Tax=Corynebacterium flavescens TaxID=28028 RepID=UPI003FD62823